MGLGLLAALSVLCGNLSGALGSSLPSPKWARFQQSFFPHFLEWAPGHNDSASDLYEVEYIKYGDKEWKPAVHCMGISNHICDLTAETMNPSNGYVGRVRAVSGNLTSNWTRTLRFTLQEVKLAAPDVVLELEGNTIRVMLHHPLVHFQNITVRYEDIFKYNRAYRVHITRTSDNQSFTQNEESTQFELTKLAWGQQYCLIVYPVVKSRPNLGISSEAQCVSLPEEAQTGLIVLISFSCIFVLCMLLVFGNILACWYVRKPAETPNSLKSPMKAGSYWMEQWQPPLWLDDVVVCLDEESSKRLSMIQKNSTVRLSTDSGFCGDKISLENEGQSLESAFENHEHRPASPPVLENSWNGTESGISSKDSNSGLTQLGSPESQGYRKQDNVVQENPSICNDSGIGMGQNLPFSMQSASGSESVLGVVNNEQDKADNESACPIGVISRVFEDVECHGYLKQIKSTNQTRENKIHCQHMDDHFGPVPWCSLHKPYQQDVECNQDLSAANGYLKQASKQPDNFSNMAGIIGRNDISVHVERGPTMSLTKLEQSESHLHHYSLGEPATLKDSYLDQKVGEANPGILICETRRLFPLTRTADANEGFHLEFSALSLADVDIKDR